MARISFKVESKAYDEIEIGDKVYNVYYDDESLDEYRKKAKKYHKKSNDYNKIDTSKLNEKEIDQYKQDVNLMAKDLIESFFGEGTFDEIFSYCGKSSVNLIGIVNQLFEWLNSKLNVSDSETLRKYKTKNKK